MNLPNHIELSVYPNPFNSELIIRVNSNNRSNSGVNIFDILGRHVAKLDAVNGQTLHWKPTGLSSGKYFIVPETLSKSAQTVSVLYVK